MGALGREAGVAIDDIGLRRPTLDDVVLSLTGHAAEPPPPDDAGDGPGRGDQAEPAVAGGARS